MTTEREQHWRWRLDRPIAVLRQEPADLEPLGVVFEDDFDELDRLRHAPVRGASGRLYALVRHARSPSPGTEVVTRSDSPHPARDLDEALVALGLRHTDVMWAHPEATETVPKDDVPRLDIQTVRSLVADHWTVPAFFGVALLWIAIRIAVARLAEPGTGRDFFLDLFVVSLAAATSVIAGYWLRGLRERRTSNVAKPYHSEVARPRL